MKVLVIGAVGTTALAIEMLHSHGFQVTGVLGHEPLNSNRVSGLNDLATLCKRLGFDYRGYRRINDPDHILWAAERGPEVIFAVGFSQLLSQEWLRLPKLGCVGFHPTVLPDGRGRAPVAWTILENKEGAASFFLMGEGADDGPVFVQEKFALTEEDDASTFASKLRHAIKLALNNWLPELKAGIWNPIPQDESKATYYGKREPCDALIDWNQDALAIDRLIKASAPPHPGAFTFCGESVITIWKSNLNNTRNYKGVIGRILLSENNSLLIQCGHDTTLWIDKYEHHQIEGVLKVGDKLGNLFQNQMDEIINNFVWKKNEK